MNLYRDCACFACFHNKNMAYSNLYTYVIFYCYQTPCAEQQPPHQEFPCRFEKLWFNLSIKMRIRYINKCAELHSSFIGQTIKLQHNWFALGLIKLYKRQISLENIKLKLAVNNTLYQIEFRAIVRILAAQAKINWFKKYKPASDQSLRALSLLELIRTNNKFTDQQLVYLASNSINVNIF